MTSAEQHEQHEGMKRHERDTLCALIGEHVLHALGEPSNLCKLVVRPLWKDRYRVNILVGECLASAKIANSYFVVTDGNGNILGSRPEIAKEY
jgi:hypothetical protein